jgi:NAD kinase
LIVSPSSTVTLSVDEATRVIIDGTESVVLDPHDHVACSLDGPMLRLVRAPGSIGFYEQLKQKLGWGRPLVREGRK